MLASAHFASCIIGVVGGSKTVLFLLVSSFGFLVPPYRNTAVVVVVCGMVYRPPLEARRRRRGAMIFLARLSAAEVRL